MVLNYIWISFFLVALLVAIIRTVGGESGVFQAIVDSTFSLSEVAFDISIGLTGILCLWLGIMKIGEKGGAVQALSRLVGPFFNKLFPDVPEDHPARGAMLMNFSANMLGLDNAATPMGLKAMNDLQQINDKKDTASNAMIMFLVLNTSGLTLIPVAVMNYRSSFGAENPADIFIPILISTFFASIVGLIVVAIYQKINLFDKVILAYVGGLTAVIIGLIVYFNHLTPEELQSQSALLSNIILYGIICIFIIMGLTKKINIYESFVEGAKDGFGIAIKIIPYLVAILVSIGVFRASGAMDFLMDGFKFIFGYFFENVAFVDGLPTAFMKPLSGSGARGMMIESFNTFGVDSFVGKLTSTLQGATDTTFYIIAVYFGSVGIRKTRYAIKAGLLADLGGIIAGIIIATMFFGGDADKEILKPNTVVQNFTSNWNNHQPSENLEYMQSSCVLYDQAYDTLCYNSNEVVDNFMALDSTANIDFLVSSIKTVGEAPDEVVYAKLSFLQHTILGYHAGEQEIPKSYAFTFSKGKIKSIQYLGNF
ncbi:MAG: spore maturation protein SpmA [Crocinitomix sp.]